MKSKFIFPLGLIFSIISLFVIAGVKENGDSNAVSMYLVVFIVPVIVLAALNAVYINSLRRVSNQLMRSVLAFIPSILFLILSLTGPWVVKGIDADLGFATLVAGISFVLTNLIWLIRCRTASTSSNEKTV